MSSSPFPAHGSGAPDVQPPTPEGGHQSELVLIDRLGDLADRLGTSVAGLVMGAVVVLAAVCLGVVALTSSDSTPAELTIPYASPVSVAETNVEQAAELAQEPGPILVHAAGAVAHPGVYLIEPDARVADLLAAAGGPLPSADLDRVNLAAPVADGSRVYVPAEGEAEPPAVVAGHEGPRTGTGGGDVVDPGALVDLNRASSAELQSLPGIGPATAEAIIEHRERHGPFGRVDDLLAVRGIGDAKLAALRDRVHV